jgi:hypothetical protein
MRKYDELMTEHQALQKQLADGRDSLELGRVERYISQLREAGVNISNLQHRDQLRTILTYWGAFVYEESGRFPLTQLAPYEPDAIPGPDEPHIAPQEKIPTSKETLLWYILAFAITVVLVWAAVAFAWPRLSTPKIAIESPFMLQEIVCVPQTSCPLTVKGSVTRGLMSRTDPIDLCVLTFIHPESSSLWYPWKARGPDESGVWEGRLGLGSFKSPPAPDQEFGVVASLVTCAWFLQNLKPADDFGNYLPVASSRVITVTPVITSPVELAPQLSQLDAEYVPFSSSRNLDQVMEMSWVDGNEAGKLGLHTSFSSSPRAFGGWSIKLPPGNSLDARNLRSVSFWVKGEKAEENFEAKLQDVTGLEVAVQVARYAEITTEWQKVSIPLQDFAAQGLDLANVQVLTFGFREEFGDVAIVVGEIVFE